MKLAGCLFPHILLSTVMRVGSYDILTLSMEVVVYCLFLYRASFVIYTSLGLSGGELLVLLLLDIWLEYSFPQRLLSGK